MTSRYRKRTMVAMEETTKKLSPWMAATNTMDSSYKVMTRNNKSMTKANFPTKKNPRSPSMKQTLKN